MSPDFSWTKRRHKNKIVPIDDLSSERIQVAPERFIRVLHYSPKNDDSSSVDNRDSRTSRTNSCESQKDNDNIIVIFFIHGVGGCAELWYEQLIHFCKAGYSVVAPDLLGHGGSSCPRDPKQYQFTELANDIMVVFDRFSRKRNILVGHSYGSSFCCVIASMRSRRVSKVVLISGGAPIPLSPESCSVFCLPIPMLTCVKPLLLWSYERRAFYRTYRSTVGLEKLRAFSAPLYVIKAVLQGQVWEVGDENFHNELMVPALLLHGAQDKFVTLQEEQWMQEAIYSSSLEIIQESGHMVMLECPDKVNWFIHNFLQRDPTTRSILTSREMSKDSIHVKAKVSFSPRKLSLAVESSEYQIDKNQDRSHSETQIRRGSAVSLTVPGTCTSGFRSNSLPGSSTNLDDVKRDSKIKFQGVQIHVSNEKTCEDEIMEAKQNENINTNNYSNDDQLVVATNKEYEGTASSLNSCGSPKQRRKGMLKISTGLLPSVET